MIVSNLYATNATIAHPYPNADIVDEYANRVQTLGDDKVGSYYLGWIKKSTLPSNCLSSCLTVDGEEGSRTFTWENITDDGNFPCGYIGNYFYGANQFNRTLSGDLWYINKLYPEYSCNMEDVKTSWFFYLYDSTGEHLLGSSDSRMSIPIKTFAKLCMGYTDTSFTITVRDESSSPAIDRRFTLTPDNLGHLMDDSDEYLEWIEEDDSEQSAHCKLRVALRGFYVSTGRRYDYRPQYEPFNVQWFVKTTCTLNGDQFDHYAYSQGPDIFYPFTTEPFSGGGFDSYQYIFMYPYTNVNNFANKIIQFGVHGEFTESQLQAFISSQNQYIVSNNILGVKYISTQLMFFPLFKFTDIFKCMCLQYRTDIDVTSYPGSYLQGYIYGRTYATDVTPEDEFLAKWKTGDIIDPAFKNSLRPWQYENFQENDFTEDDIPQPEPEPGGDTPGDEPQDMPHDDGDPPDLQKNRNIGIPSNFVTQYALTSAEVSTVGSNLWRSWLTSGTDVWKNFFLPYAQDFGTLNIAACMDYIISLKIFPFEFTIDYILPAANGVRMGTGHTDFLGSAAAVVKSQIICVDAGSCTVTLPNPYNDFRDMYNCSALCLMPYCGSVELNLQEILGRTIKASYFIDCQSGGCTCVIECEGDEGDYIIASKTGQIGFSLPMTATNAGQLTAQLMGDATKALSTLSGFYFGAGRSQAENLMSLGTALFSKNTGISKGKDGKNSMSLLANNTFETSMEIGEQAVDTGLSLANQAIDMLSRSGVEMPMLSGGGSAESFMFADCVSIQIRRGKYKKPDNYPHSVGHYNLSSHSISYYRGAFSGIPSTGSNTGKGFCTFTGIDTSGLDCREDEVTEIVKLLESGVYL
jgi:hypothetical protein